MPGLERSTTFEYNELNDSFQHRPIDARRVMEHCGATDRLFHWQSIGGPRDGRWRDQQAKWPTRLFVLWRPIEWASFAALVDIARNWSTVDVNDYTSFDVSPTVSLTLRF